MPANSKTFAVVVVLALCAAARAVGQAAPAQPWLSPTLSFTLRESYDSNVFIQDRTKLGDRGSFITTAIPSVGLQHVESGTNATNFCIGYAPEIALYHDEPTETYVSNVATTTLSLRRGDWLADTTQTLIYTDGEHTAETYTDRGGAPDMGAPWVRDRRDQTAFRGLTHLQYNPGPFFIRPVFQQCIQDFHILKRATPGYQNYEDRSDINGGLDVGVRVLPETYLTVGYRYGQQTQDTVLTSPIQSSNTYQRALFGIEGKPLSWLQLNIAAGPEYHHFGGILSPGADEEVNSVFIDGGATLTLSPADQVTISAKRFQFVSSLGKCAYIDMTYQAIYRHRFTDRLTGRLTARLYGGDWDEPISREDRVYTISPALEIKLSSKLAMEVSWQYDQGESNVPDSPGREFHRQIVCTQLKYTF